MTTVKTTDRTTHVTDFVKSDIDQAVFLGNPAVDDLMTTVIALGAEVWALRRRVWITELLLQEQKTVTPAMIEAYVLTPEQELAFKKERDMFVQTAFGHMARPGGSIAAGSTIDQNAVR
jgi:hypothetical protein